MNYADRARDHLYVRPATSANDSMTPERRLAIHNTVPPVTRSSTKLYYAEWIKTIPWARSDWLVGKMCEPPYKEHHYARVVQIQEVHLFCNFDHKERPMAMEVVNSNQVRWWTNVEDWKRVVPPYQPEWHIPVPNA